MKCHVLAALLDLFAFLERSTLPFVLLTLPLQSSELTALIRQASPLARLHGRAIFDKPLVAFLPNLPFAAAGLIFQFHDLIAIRALVR